MHALRRGRQVYARWWEEEEEREREQERARARERQSEREIGGAETTGTGELFCVAGLLIT